MQNEKLKQLEKIYMPKPDKKLKTKRDNSVSRISSRKDWPIDQPTCKSINNQPNAW